MGGGRGQELEGMVLSERVRKPACLVIELGDEEEIKRTSTEEELPLSPGAKLFHEPNMNLHIIAVLGVGKKIDITVLKSGIEATLIHHPRFSSLQVLDTEGRGAREGNGKWVRTRVEVDKHLVVPDLSNLSVPSPEQFLEDYISDLSTTSLDLSKPLWEIHVLNLRTSEAESVAIFRCHHSLGDGVSLMSLLLACFRKTSDPNSLPTIPNKTKQTTDKSNRWGVGDVLGFLVGCLMFARMMWNTVVDVFWFTATSSSWLKDTDTPITGREGVQFNKKRFVHKTLLLEDIKCVKFAMNGTVNDVLLGITSAGLTRYLSRRYGEDDDDYVDGGKEKLPKNILLRSTVLVNVRKAQGLHVLADMMDDKKNNSAKFGNWIGFIILPFPIVQRNNPLDYVRTAIKISNRKKESGEANFTCICTQILLKIFGVKTAASLSHKVISNTTLSFSNIVGPLEEVSFYGHPLVYIAPSVFGHAHALTIHFQSYMGKMKMVIAVDETVIPDPHQLCMDLSDSLDQMKKAVVSSTKPENKEKVTEKTTKI